MVFLRANLDKALLELFGKQFHRITPFQNVLIEAAMLH